MLKNTLFFISAPEKLYLDKSISILGGLKAEILTRVVCGLCRPFLKWPPLESVFFLVAQKYFVLLQLAFKIYM